MSDNLSENLSDNPLVAIPFAIPFPLLKAEQIEPAIAHLISLADARITSIETMTTTPTYHTIVGATWALDAVTMALAASIGGAAWAA